MTNALFFSLIGFVLIIILLTFLYQILREIKSIFEILVVRPH